MNAISCSTSWVTRPPAFRMHEGVAEFHTQDVRRVDPPVHAGDDDHLVFGNRGESFVGTGASKGAVAVEEGVQVGHGCLISLVVSVSELAMSLQN